MGTRPLDGNRLKTTPGERCGLTRPPKGGGQPRNLRIINLYKIVLTYIEISVWEKPAACCKGGAGPLPLASLPRGNVREW